MKTIFYIPLLFLFLACSKQKEITPENPNLFKNGDFTHPFEVNEDFYGDCGCKPKLARAFYCDPLNDLDIAMVLLTEENTYPDSAHVHHNYYTDKILIPGESYELKFKLYYQSVHNLKLYQVDGELIGEYSPNDFEIQSVKFIAGSSRIRFEGICTIGKLSLKRYICQ